MKTKTKTIFLILLILLPLMVVSASAKQSTRKKNSAILINPNLDCIRINKGIDETPEFCSSQRIFILKEFTGILIIDVQGIEEKDLEFILLFQGIKLFFTRDRPGLFIEQIVIVRNSFGDPRELVIPYWRYNFNTRI